ncbi:hypothetical protein LINPERPRIM_LOCUS32927 [Linum perenne]
MSPTSGLRLFHRLPRAAAATDCSSLSRRHRSL